MNNELIHYLNSGVKVRDEYGNITELNLRTASRLIDNKHSVAYLYPLSCLTELIPIDGEMKIPLVELAKIEGSLRDSDYRLDTIEGIVYFRRLRFGYSNYKKSFFCETNDGLEDFTVNNQLALFQKMFEWKINVFPDKIKSIDPRELGDNNPYKI